MRASATVPVQGSASTSSASWICCSSVVAFCSLHRNCHFEYRPKTLIVAGGVACNGALREAARVAAAKLGLPVYFPSPHLSTDNAAMIAAAGTVKLEAGERAGWDLNADVMLRLQNIEVEDDELRKHVRYRL